MSAIEDFFVEIDDLWPDEPAPVAVSIIGCGALMLQVDYERGTKDSDVFETTDLTPPIRDQLLSIAGPGTTIHKRRRMYVDIVSSGIPFLPRAPRWLPVAVNGQLSRLVLSVLDITDVVVSKLKRFNENDKTDIDAMIDQGHVARDHLVERFRSAFVEFSMDARAADLPGYVGNLHRVERDMFGVEETEFDLDSLRY